MTYQQLLRRAKRKILIDALVACDWSVPRAAKALSLNRTAFYRVMHKSGLRPAHTANRGNTQWRALQ